MGKQKPHFKVNKSEFERMCHITDTSSTPSRVSCRKGPFFFKLTAFQLLPRVRNVQKSYYGPCKTEEKWVQKAVSKILLWENAGWVPLLKNSWALSSVTANMPVMHRTKSSTTLTSVSPEWSRSGTRHRPSFLQPYRLGCLWSQVCQLLRHWADIQRQGHAGRDPVHQRRRTLPQLHWLLSPLPVRVLADKANHCPRVACL